MARERAFAKEIASLDAIFSFLDEFYVEQAIPRREALALSLVVEELFTNLVKYNTASRNPIGLRLGREGGTVAFELTDRDVDRFDPALVPDLDPDAPMSERRSGGLGLHLVRAIVDRITFDYTDRVMRIAVVKELERGDVRDSAG
jgi:anti-sigma regulatory factor (Ser/Thr protein kinase)